MESRSLRSVRSCADTVHPCYSLLAYFFLLESVLQDFETAPTHVSRTPNTGSRTTALECHREHRRGASRIPHCASARMDFHQRLEGSGASVFSQLHRGLEGAGCQKRKMDYPGPFRRHDALQWELGSLCKWRTYFWTIASVARLGWGLPNAQLGSVAQPCPALCDPWIAAHQTYSSLFLSSSLDFPCTQTY